MRPVFVVVADEFAQHRRQVLLVQHDQVVEALATECPNDALGDRVRPRSPNGRGDAVDIHATGPLAEVATIHGISIAEQMPWLLPPMASPPSAGATPRRRSGWRSH